MQGLELGSHRIRQHPYVIHLLVLLAAESGDKANETRKIKKTASKQKCSIKTEAMFG